MENDPWYYLEARSTVGPVTWARLRDLRRTEIIQDDTLVWNEGAKDWQPYASARDVVDAGPIIDAKGWASLPTAPWRRYFARFIDVSYNGCIGAILFGFAFYSLLPISAEQFFTIFDGPWGGYFEIMFAVVISLPVTAVFVGLTGSSLGKWVFGVRVLSSELRPLGVAAALGREFHVWMSGLGFGIPFISAIMMILSYSRLKKKRVTDWDEAGAMIVLHRPAGTGQTVLNVIGVFLIISILIAEPVLIG